MSMKMENFAHRLIGKCMSYIDWCLACLLRKIEFLMAVRMFAVSLLDKEYNLTWQSSAW